MYKCKKNAKEMWVPNSEPVHQIASLEGENEMNGLLGTVDALLSNQ